MINKEGDMDLIFVDYDNAGYGYRAWDLLYNMLSWPQSAWVFIKSSITLFLSLYFDFQAWRT